MEPEGNLIRRRPRLFQLPGRTPTLFKVLR